MGYYDICQAPLFLAANGKRLVHLTYDFSLRQYGDINAKVGAGNKTDVNGIYGIGRRNERGERLVEFCK